MTFFRRWLRAAEEDRDAADVAEAVRSTVASQLADLREAMEAISEREERRHGGRRAQPG